MGLLDQVIGGLMGNTGSASPIQSVLMNLLTRGQNSGGYAPVQAPAPSQTAGGQRFSMRRTRIAVFADGSEPA